MPAATRPSRARDRGPGSGGSLVVAGSVGMPHAIFRGGDLVEGAPRGHALGLGLDHARGASGARRAIPLLDQEPAPPIGITPLASPDPHERPPAVELPAREDELEIAVAVALVRVAVGLPGAAVPDHHRAAAVFALRDGSLEVAVLERMILHLHGEALVGGVEAGPLGHRPALEGALELEPEVVVEPAGHVLLDHEGSRARAAPRGRRRFARRLRRGLEVPLATILAQPHLLIFPRLEGAVHRKPGRAGSAGRHGVYLSDRPRGRPNSRFLQRSRAWPKAPSSSAV